jgi:hypothetical protein
MIELKASENLSVFQEARGNLAFLLSALQCGEALTDDEEANVKRVIQKLFAAENASKEALSEICRLVESSESTAHFMLLNISRKLKSILEPSI